MKLVVIGPVYPYRGGIAHYTSMLSQKLIDRDHDMHLISFKRQYPAWLYPGKTDRDPSQKRLNLNVDYLLDPLYPWTWYKTSKFIEEFNPDGVIIQWWTTFWGPAYWVLTKMLHNIGIKVIYIIHNVTPHESQPWDRWLAAHVLRLGDAQLVQAASEEAHLLSLVPDAHPTLCPMPVFNMFPVDDALTKDAAREDLGIRKDIPIMLFFGIVRPYKGLKYAIEAVSILRESGIQTHLIVVGEFWDDISAYEAQISQLDLKKQVTLENRYIPDEEVGQYFKAADIFVAPYIDGTQSASVKTAIAFQLPVVITECITDDLLRKNKLTSIVPNGDSQALAEAIGKFIIENTTNVWDSNQKDESWISQVHTIEKMVSQAILNS